MSASTCDPNSEFSFRDLQLSAPILAAIEESGYTTPTPIQAGTIPPLLEGKDVLGQAQTGTGKTAAFAIPMLQRIDLSQKSPQVLVLTPTRELAIQVAKAFEKYASGMRGLRVVPIYGGQGYEVQLRELRRGVQVVVGTPGRVMDHLRRGTLNLEGLKGLVLDEADEMLQMGFAEDVDWILTHAPAQRQTALFSATMPSAIRRIAQRHLKSPIEITIKQQTATADTVHQRYVVAAPHQKQALLARILETEPIDGVIVFVRTRSTTEPLADYLAQHGHRAAALSGEVSQKQRERIVDDLRSGKLDIIIATDVAARGLDVQRISHVINYDLPADSESYVHRIGRTGRAGRSGSAIVFLHPRDRRLLKRVEMATRQTIEPMEIPTKRDINQRRVARFHETITQNLAHPDMKNFASVVEQYRREHEDVPIEQIAAALAAMAVGNSQLFVTEDMQFSDFVDARDRDPRGRGTETDRRGRPKGRSERGYGDEADAGKMETFRIEVGSAHQVKPGNIVGAIANETGLESSFIGRIEIYDEFSTVDLRAGMPHDVFHSLKHVSVSGRPLNISRLDKEVGNDERRSNKRFGGNKRPYRNDSKPSRGRPAGKRTPSGR